MIINLGHLDIYYSKRFNTYCIIKDSIRIWQHREDIPFNDKVHMTPSSSKEAAIINTTSAGYLIIEAPTEVENYFKKWVNKC